MPSNNKSHPNSSGGGGLQFKMSTLVLAATAGAIILVIIFMSTLSTNDDHDTNVHQLEPTSSPTKIIVKRTKKPLPKNMDNNIDENGNRKKRNDEEHNNNNVIDEVPPLAHVNNNNNQNKKQNSENHQEEEINVHDHQDHQLRQHESIGSDAKDDEYSSEPEDPVYHNKYPIPRRRKIFKQPPKIEIDDKTTSKAAESAFNAFYDSFNNDNLYKHHTVVPVLIAPTFHDGDVLRDMLEHISVPIRHFIFICNADDDRVSKVLRELAPLEKVGGMTVFHYDGDNRGFAKSINLGLRRGRQVLLGYSEFAFLPKWDSKKLPIWYAPINCDAVFREGAWQKFAIGTNKELINPTKDAEGRVPGLFYGHVIDHYAFGVADAAIRKAGYFDEVFYPAYMEDIDFKWRIHIGGFRTIQFSNARIDHHQSINLKRAGGASNFRTQMHRAGLGFEYGWMKWGYYEQPHTRREFPPSKRVHPFGIEGFPLHLWKIDPTHRHCIKTAQGVYFEHSTTCWYNGTGLLKSLKKMRAKPPHGESEWKLPRFLTEPVPSMRDYLAHGTQNNRKD